MAVAGGDGGASTRTVSLKINLELIAGFHGDGPLNGTAKPLGALVMGTDLVAVDATCCRLMGLPAERISHLTLGAHKRLGVLPEERVRQLGETIASKAKPFDTVDLWKHIHVGPRDKEKLAVEAEKAGA